MKKFLLNAESLSQTIPNQQNTNADRWFLLAPFGDHPHRLGLQRVDQKSVDTMVAGFHSFWGRIKRAFVGRSVYLGHPDAQSDISESEPDRSVYGLIADLRADSRGLLARILLNPEGANLVDAGFNRLSPYWLAERCVEKGTGTVFYRPVELISVGLTNHPNILAESLSNSKENGGPVTRDKFYLIKTKAITVNLREGYPSLGENYFDRERIRRIVREKCSNGCTYDEAFGTFFK